MKVRVTQDHIDRGKRLNPDLCPIAIALADEGWRQVEVACGAALSRERSGLLPVRVSAWVSDFDEGATVKPFEFEFEDVQRAYRNRTAGRNLGRSGMSLAGATDVARATWSDAERASESGWLAARAFMRGWLWGHRRYLEVAAK